MIKKGVDTTLPILTKLRSFFVLLEPSHQEAIRLSSGFVEVLEAETQLPIGKMVLIDDPI